MTRIVAPYEGVPFAGWDEAAPIPAPLALHACVVRPEWTDYNGHMSESVYLLVMGDSSDAFFRFFGIDEAYRASGFSLYTLETRIRNLDEASDGDPLNLTLELIDLDARRLHIFHRMTNATTGARIAIGEQILGHVDMKAGRIVALPETMHARLEAIRRAHARLPRDPMIGSTIGLRRKEQAS